MRARVVAVVLCGLLLASACGSNSATDGGAGGNSEWTMVVPPGSSYYTAVWVDTPGTIYAVERGSIFPGYGAPYSAVASHDDGASWTTVPLTDSGATINAVAAVGSTDVYAVGFTYDGPESSTPLVAKSTDRGATFTLVTPAFAGILSGVAADGAGNPIAVGSTTSGLYARSLDSGATWSAAPVPGTTWLDGVWTTAAGTIYACGEATIPGATSDGGTDAAAPDGGPDAGYGTALDPAGVVVRSDDDGGTWTTVAITPAPLHAISGTPDGQRIVAVGFGYTNVESTDAGATWIVHCGSDANTETFSEFASVWVQDATAAPFIGAGNAPYVVRTAIGTGTASGRPGIEGWEALPSLGNVTGLEPGAIAVAGNGPNEIWAVGTGIFHRQPGP